MLRSSLIIFLFVPILTLVLLMFVLMRMLVMLMFMLMLVLLMLSFMLIFFTIKFHDHRDLAGVFVDIIARVILILRQKRGQQVSLSTFFGTIKRSATQHSPFATKRKPTIIQLTSNQLKLDCTDQKKTKNVLLSGGRRTDPV